MCVIRKKNRGGNNISFVNVINGVSEAFYEFFSAKATIEIVGYNGPAFIPFIGYFLFLILLVLILGRLTKNFAKDRKTNG